MGEALLLGFISQSSLLLSGLFVYWMHVPKKVVGVLAGFGAGALVSAVAFDLIPQAEHLSNLEMGFWMLFGAAIFLGGDAIVERKFGDKGSGGAMGIVIGSVVDGVPESLIFGIQIAAGLPISTSFLASVFVSNIPQALAPSADLAQSGWKIKRTGLLWLAVVAACALASGIGWGIADLIPDAQGERAAALAAGGLLAMLTNSLMPFAFERGGNLAGIATVVGFCIALMST